MSTVIPKEKRKEDKATAYIKKTDNPRMGRPTANPKTHETRIRMSDEDVQLLSYCCEKTGKTKADIIREGIREVYKKLQKQNP